MATTIVSISAGTNSFGPYPTGTGNGYYDGATNGGHACGSVTSTPAPPTLQGVVINVLGESGGGTTPGLTLCVAGSRAQDFFTSVQVGATTYLTSAATWTQFTVSSVPYTRWVWAATGVIGTSGPYTFTIVDRVEVFNCDCESVSTYDTLANLRIRMLIRLGYPNQTTTPPPGMLALIDEFLRGAQNLIYRQVRRAALRTERFFKWTMVPGQRYYNIAAEEDGCDMLDPYKISWVGFEDLNKAWYRLDEGIPPEYYTRANINFGWPTRYEIRSCIEIFPAPQAAYTLWIKGDFDLGPLVAPTDRCTIDDEAVFLLALGNAKTHYGQKDANSVTSQAGNYIKGLVAGSHGTRRYVPRSQTENPLTPPRFLPLGSDQA